MVTPGSPLPPTPRRAPSRHPALLVDLAAVLFACAIVVHAHAFFLSPRPAMMSLGEGAPLAEARRLLEGHLLPYVDAFGTSGPVFAWIVALAVKVVGGGWMPARVLVLGSMLATIVLGASAAFVARRAVTAALMALVYVGLTVTFLWRDAGLVLGPEHVGNVFVMGALLCFTRGARRRGRRFLRPWALAAGALAMLGALCKLVDLVALVPLAFWALSLDLRRPGRKTELASLLAGAALPVVLVLARYAIAGELRALSGALGYGLTRYLPSVHVLGKRDYLRELVLGHFDLLIVWAGLTGAAAAIVFGRMRRPRDLVRTFAATGFDATVALAGVLVLGVVDCGLEVFEWDYVPVIPWAALLVGVTLERSSGLSLLRRARSRWRPALVHAVLLVPLAVALQLGWTMRLGQYRLPATRDAFETASWPLCTYLAQHTVPSDTIFLWGDDAAPYVACNRAPASRYVTSGAVAGFVPWVDEPETIEVSRAVPGALDTLVRELKDRRPAVILNSVDTLMGRSMIQHTELDQLLRASYCRSPAYGPTLWVRSPKDGCSSATPGARPLLVYWSGPRSASSTVASPAGIAEVTATADERVAAAGAVFDAPAPGLKPLRLFQSGATGGRLTVATDEGDAKAREMGYAFVRVEGYVFEKPAPGAVPLNLFYQPTARDFCTAASDSWSPGYELVGTQGYVPAQDVVPDLQVIEP